MFPLTDDAENQTVAGNADDKNQRVENGKEDPSRFLVDEHIASLVCGAVGQWHCGKIDHFPVTVRGTELWLMRKHIPKNCTCFMFEDLFHAMLKILRCSYRTINVL